MYKYLLYKYAYNRLNMSIFRPYVPIYIQKLMSAIALSPTIVFLLQQFYPKKKNKSIYKLLATPFSIR